MKFLRILLTFFCITIFLIYLLKLSRSEVILRNTGYEELVQIQQLEQQYVQILLELIRADAAGEIITAEQHKSFFDEFDVLIEESETIIKEMQNKGARMDLLEQALTIKKGLKHKVDHTFPQDRKIVDLVLKRTKDQ